MYNFKIFISSQGIKDIPLENGKATFVLGANGTGKSTLMHYLYRQNPHQSRRILAHRQMWFRTNSNELSSASKKQTEIDMRNTDINPQSRWKDEYSHLRSSMSVFDLISSENTKARQIANAAYKGAHQLVETLAKEPSPISLINELFAMSNIPIVISLENDDQLFASKNGSTPYSIAELSDGERNALLICSDVLTAPKNHLIILDEPERHLHRSIVSPLLSSLIQKRKDCAFVISTHDIYLPIDQNKSSILLVRGCTWNEGVIQHWDADIISDLDEIDEEVKLEILGAKRNILFVEGTSTSLDKQIYQLIFPDVTVLSMGNCSQVEKAVEGIRGTQNIHWINAIGLIDADDRTPEQIQILLKKRVVALDCYSVESLYYKLDIIKKVAYKFADVLGQDGDMLYTKAISNIIPNIYEHKDRLCARLCEKQLRNRVTSSLPNYKDILLKEDYVKTISTSEALEAEIARFENLVNENKLDELISRYPVRDTKVLTDIAAGIGIDRTRYESAVRAMIVQDINVKNYYRAILQKLTDLIMHNEQFIETKIVQLPVSGATHHVVN